MQKTQQEDGIVRPLTYAKWRMDKEAEPGHSRELVATTLDPKFYDNIGG